MIQRSIEKKLREDITKYPIVTLTGPRQSGKTTLLKNVLPGYDYVSLEDPDERDYAFEDPRGFLSRFKKKTILDEVQHVPDLFSYIQTIVDNRDVPGQFILSGSQNFLLLSGISQSLAGRTSILHLLPFTKRELANKKVLTIKNLYSDSIQRSSKDLFQMMFTGFYPRIHDKKLPPQEWLADYFQTYIQRDVRQIINVTDIGLFGRFVRLCAGRIGQLLNLSSLAADCGISHKTAQRWISLLESSFVIYKILPHHKNYSKRMIKSPKLYFYDSGLVCYLLRIKSPDNLRISPYRGHIFESFCISEFIKSAYHQKITPDIFFWRDSSGHEIDMIIEQGEKLIPCEIKSGETFTKSFVKGLKYWLKLSGTSNKDGFLLYGGSKKMIFKNINVFPWSML
ncbi:MAG: AAA family ATPase [Deltaproteobacteria bacterium]|nr:MAG: AAA family ATPase [Deltaproteobacteria bacterium]